MSPENACCNGATVKKLLVILIYIYINLNDFLLFGTIKYYTRKNTQ